MNTSRYVCLPDLESTDEEEEEKDPIAKLSKKQKKEELGRKDRWIAKFEKESREVDDRSVGAINRADRCINDIDRELNEKESSYSKYKTAVNKLDESCIKKIERISAKERSLNRFVYGRNKPSDLDSSFAKPTWANHGYRHSARKANGKYRGVYLRKDGNNQENGLNNTEVIESKRPLSNAIPKKTLPKEIQDKIDKNRRAL